MNLISIKRYEYSNQLNQIKLALDNRLNREIGRGDVVGLIWLRIGTSDDGLMRTR
jgi:hypothetical protein